LFPFGLIAHINANLSNIRPKMSKNFGIGMLQ